MTIERRGRYDFEVGLVSSDAIDDCGQIAFEVHSQSEEIGNHDDSRGSLLSKLYYSAFQIGDAEFQECRFHAIVRTRACQTRRHRAHRLISRFNSGTVSENDDPRAHTLP